MQGELQGAVNAANSLATIIGPLAATQIFNYFTHAADSPGYFPGAPFLAAGIVLVGGGDPLPLRRRPLRPQPPAERRGAPGRARDGAAGQINIPTPRGRRHGDETNGNGNGHPPRY